MTSRPWALLDTDVVVARVAEEHPHHGASVALITTDSPVRFAIAAHSMAEAYSTLTRRNAPAPYHWPSAQAWSVLDSIASETTLVGLSPPQTFEAIRRYATGGHIGPRLYDWLIGQAAVHGGMNTIVTWNVGHMRSLFPDLDVVDPIEALARRAR